MLKLRRTESVNIDVRIFFADVVQEIDVPLERQFRMMPALHQYLHSTCSSEFVQLLIKLLEAQHVMIFVAFGPVKRAELAVHVADIRVIDVAIHDVGHDLAAAAAVTFRLRQIAPRIGKRSQLFQRPTIQFQCVVLRNPRALQDFFRERISVK
jgi:hypothetical protein